MLCSTIAFCFPLYLQGQNDVEGSADHPMITRYPGSYISAHDVEKYREYDLAIGPITGYRYIEKREKIAGKVTRITYQLDESAEDLSIGEVYQDYLQAFQEAGVNILGKGMFPQSNVANEVGGGSWIGVALKPNAFTMGHPANYLFAGTSSSGGSFAIIGESSGPAGKTYLAMYGERHSKDLVICHLDVIEAKGAETGKVSVDADYISKQIEERGSVSIYGIEFEFDKSEIQPDSRPVLDEIAGYMKSNPGVALYVVGHTDMKGTYAYNLKLSQDRARAVADALIKDYGIPSKRLIPHGVAFLSPKSNNTSEEGRSANRRTELVRVVAAN